MASKRHILTLDLTPRSQVLFQSHVEAAAPPKASCHVALYSATSTRLDLR